MRLQISEESRSQQHHEHNRIPTTVCYWQELCQELCLSPDNSFAAERKIYSSVPAYQ